MQMQRDHVQKQLDDSLRVCQKRIHGVDAEADAREAQDHLTSQTCRYIISEMIMLNDISLKCFSNSSCIDMCVYISGHG